MIRAIALSLLAAISVQASGTANPAITTEEQAIKTAITALETKFGKAVVERYQPYAGHLKAGIWYVSSALALSPGQRGGGRPEAEIRASNGKATKLYLSR